MGGNCKTPHGTNVANAFEVDAMLVSLVLIVYHLTFPAEMPSLFDKLCLLFTNLQTFTLYTPLTHP